MRKIDLGGKFFGEWVVIGQSLERGNRGQIKWDCACSCGSVKAVQAEALKKGQSKSCGCLKRSAASKRATTHGMSQTRIYRAHRHMIDRCNNKNVDMYSIYGGRGIKVCTEWMDFVVFADWAESNGYKKHLTLDRKDNDKGYCPDNCRWVTITEQQRNKRNNVLTIEVATEIRRLRGIGERNIDIANKFNISPSLASEVYHNKIWKKENRR